MLWAFHSLYMISWIYYSTLAFLTDALHWVIIFLVALLIYVQGDFRRKSPYISDQTLPAVSLSDELLNLFHHHSSSSSLSSIFLFRFSRLVECARLTPILRSFLNNSLMLASTFSHNYLSIIWLHRQGSNLRPID